MDRLTAIGTWLRRRAETGRLWVIAAGMTLTLPAAIGTG